MAVLDNLNKYIPQHARRLGERVSGRRSNPAGWMGFDLPRGGKLRAKTSSRSKARSQRKWR